MKLKIFQRPGEKYQFKENTPDTELLYLLYKWWGSLFDFGLLTINGLSNVMVSWTMALFTRQMTLE